MPYLGEMLIRTTVAFLLILASCSEDVELNPLPEENWTRQASTVCSLPRYRCDPFDPEANWRCNTVCGWAGHCVEYTAQELDWCWTHPHSWTRSGGYCSPFGEPTWPTHCEDGPVPIGSVP